MVYSFFFFLKKFIVPLPFDSVSGVFDSIPIGTRGGEQPRQLLRIVDVEDGW